MNNDRTWGAIMVVGLAVIASHIVLKGSIKKAYDKNQWGIINDANGPATSVSAAYLTPPGTLAAPRMYVAHNPGSAPSSNPGESWIQGGGASITNTTGRWADVPASYAGSPNVPGQFNETGDYRFAGSGWGSA